MDTEFYNQKKWLEIHKLADEWVYSVGGFVTDAVYHSPIKRKILDHEHERNSTDGNNHAGGLR